MSMGADDMALLFVDDSLIMSASCCSVTADTASLTNLTAGYHSIVIRHIESIDSAFVTISIKVNGMVAPLSRYYPVAPGAAVPVVLTANGMAAQQACGAATLSVTPPVAPGSVVPVAEATSVSVASGTCGYMYSSHVTPVLVSALGLAAGAVNASGMGPSGIHSPSPGLLQVRLARAWVGALHEPRVLHTKDLHACSRNQR